MSVNYDIGFPQRPSIESLDAFLRELGFEVKENDKFTRMYQLLTDDAPREINLFYDDPSLDAPKFKVQIQAYANLVTYESPRANETSEDRIRAIENNNVRTEADWVEHVTPEFWKIYQVALAIRDKYNAIVCGDSGEEINPERVIVK